MASEQLIEKGRAVPLILRSNKTFYSDSNEHKKILNILHTIENMSP